ncbi:MAG: hypothetical protein V7607_1210 [Solirubrobacteraceae bacterium]
MVDDSITYDTARLLELRGAVMRALAFPDSFSELDPDICREWLNEIDDALDTEDPELAAALVKAITTGTGDHGDHRRWRTREDGA